MLRLYFYTGRFKNGKRKQGFCKERNSNEVKKILKEQKIYAEKIYRIPFLSFKAKAEDILMIFSQGKMFIKNGYPFLKILDILEENKSLKIYRIPFLSFKAKAEDILMIFSQGKMFIKNGYPFLKILDILEENKSLKIYVENMKNSLKKGESLYEIFKNSGLNLKNSELMIIKSGEQSGSIYKSFERVEKGIRSGQKTKKEIRKVMTYPVIVFTVIIFLTVFMGIYILPDFVKIIENISKEIPFITKVIIYFAVNLKIMIFIILFLTVFMGIYILPDFVKIIENISKEIPFITKVIIYFAVNLKIMIFIILVLIFSIISLLKNEKYREKLFQKLIKNKNI